MSTQKQEQAPELELKTAEPKATVPVGYPASINEPTGSTVVAPPTTPPAEQVPLVLTAIDPDSLPIGPTSDFILTVTGEGFTDQSIIAFDDEDLPTTFVSPTQLTARPPMATTAGEVDVEVADREDLSEVLIFEFVAAAGATRKEPVRKKPRKDVPIFKRPKKGKK